MNSYTLKSVKGTIATVEINIGSTKITKNFDARYIHLDNDEKFHAYFKNWIDNYTPPAESAVTICDEVEAKIGKKQAIEE